MIQHMKLSCWLRGSRYSRSIAVWLNAVSRSLFFLSPIPVKCKKLLKMHMSITEEIHYTYVVRLNLALVGFIAGFGNLPQETLTPLCKDYIWLLCSPESQAWERKRRKWTFISSKMLLDTLCIRGVVIYIYSHACAYFCRLSISPSLIRLYMYFHESREPSRIFAHPSILPSCTGRINIKITDYQL